MGNMLKDDATLIAATGRGKAVGQTVDVISSGHHHGGVLMPLTGRYRKVEIYLTGSGAVDSFALGATDCTLEVSRSYLGDRSSTHHQNYTIASGVALDIVPSLDSFAVEIVMTRVYVGYWAGSFSLLSEDKDRHSGFIKTNNAGANGGMWVNPDAAANLDVSWVMLGWV